MKYSNQFWQTIRNKRLVARKNYLDSCHTKESEVFKKTRYGERLEHFKFDGIEIQMPDYYSSDRKYKKYLFSVI